MFFITVFPSLLRMSAESVSLSGRMISFTQQDSDPNLVYITGARGADQMEDRV